MLFTRETTNEQSRAHVLIPAGTSPHPRETQFWKGVKGSPLCALVWSMGRLSVLDFSSNTTRPSHIRHIVPDVLSLYLLKEPGQHHQHLLLVQLPAKW
jgi:hypothetical protein